MPSQPARPRHEEPLINEEADRVLGRIIIRYGLLTMVLLFAATGIMAFVNIPLLDDYHQHRWREVARILSWDATSMLIVLLPFYLGIGRLSAARLRIGRDLVQRRVWREAVAALEPFFGPGRRFLDGTGEAHYLLSQAYAGAGQTARADQARQFVLRHRPGPWADKLRPAAAPPRPSPRPSPRPGRPQEKGARPANPKRRRRF